MRNYIWFYSMYLSNPKYRILYNRGFIYFYKLIVILRTKSMDNQHNIDNWKQSVDWMEPHEVKFIKVVFEKYGKISCLLTLSGAEREVSNSWRSPASGIVIVYSCPRGPPASHCFLSIFIIVWYNTLRTFFKWHAGLAELLSLEVHLFPWFLWNMRYSS